MKVDLFHNELSLLVFLAGFVGLGVGPANHGLASFAKDVTDAVKACNQ